MDRIGLQALRWLGAFVVLGLVVVVSVQQITSAFGTAVVFGSDEPTDAASEAAASEPPPPPPTEPVEDGNTRPEGDLVVRGTTVTDVGSADVQISGEGEHVVMWFPRIEGDPRCIEHVRLDTIVGADGPVEVGVWGSTLSNAPELADLAVVEEPLLLSGDPAAVASTPGAENYLPWNLTELYKEYVANPQVPDEAPFVIALRSITPNSGPLRVATNDSSEERRPLLTFLGADGCGEATEGPTETAS
ncbi:MAG TPA: hypothetical protein VIK95_11830 [Egibacteraceae bacterium]